MDPRQPDELLSTYIRRVGVKLGDDLLICVSREIESVEKERDMALKALGFPNYAAARSQVVEFLRDR